MKKRQIVLIVGHLEFGQNTAQLVKDLKANVITEKEPIPYKMNPAINDVAYFDPTKQRKGKGDKRKWKNQFRR
jgi:hypothetical protein